MSEEKDTRQKRNYWKWKPWQVTDTWKWRKKPGRPIWATGLSETSVKLEVGKIVNWMTFGKSIIEWEKNKKEWVTPNVPLTVNQACDEYWIAPITFWSHLKKFPEAKELYKQLKEDRREYLKELSETNIQKWLSGELGLSWKDLMDASFKMLEKTDKTYQPKVEIENKSIWININKSTEDIMQELQDLLWK